MRGGIALDGIGRMEHGPCVAPTLAVSTSCVIFGKGFLDEATFAALNVGGEHQCRRGPRDAGFGWYGVPNGIAYRFRKILGNMQVFHPLDAAEVEGDPIIT